MSARKLRTSVVCSLLLLTIMLVWWQYPSNNPSTSPSKPQRATNQASRVERSDHRDSATPQLSARAASIGGHLAVESGKLRLAQVCVYSASFAQAPGGSAQLAPLGSTMRCTAAAEDGSYRIANLPPGQYIVSAQAEGYLPVKYRETDVKPWITLHMSQAREDLDIMLRLRGVALRGEVHDLMGGMIEGALVFDSLGGRTVTDSDGLFTLWGIREQYDQISVSAIGYTSAAATPKAPQGRLMFWLMPESVLRARVVRDEEQESLSGLAVHLHYDDIVDAETAEDGSFEIRGLEPGIYQPFVRSEGWCGVIEPPITLGIGETSEPSTLTVHACRMLTARVIERSSGEACSAARIEILDGAGDQVRKALTDTAGEVRIAGIEPGLYTVRIRCPGHIQHDPESLVIGESMAREVIWEVDPGRTIRGSVVDRHGEVVPWTNVSFSGSWGHTQTDTDGNGQFAMTIHPGLATVTLTHPRMLSGEPLEIEIPETHDPPPIVLTFSAIEGGEVHGRVRARSGHLSGIFVVVRAIGSFAAKLRRVDNEGRFSIAGLQRIPHEIAVQRLPEITNREHSAPLADPVIVDLSEQGGAEVDFFVDLPELATLSGHVEDAEGNAEVDAIVAIQSQYSGRWRLLTNETGYFEIEVPDDASYTVNATTQDGAVLRQEAAKPGEAIVLRASWTRRVCGFFSSDALLSESLTITTDLGSKQTFQPGTERWCLARVPVGTRLLSARSNRFGTSLAQVVVPSSGHTPEVELVFAGHGSLRGQVLGADGEPLAHFKVWVLDVTGRLVGGNNYTDLDGYFVLDHVPAGDLDVIPIRRGPLLSRKELLSRSTRLHIQAGETSEVVLRIL